MDDTPLAEGIEFNAYTILKREEGGLAICQRRQIKRLLKPEYALRQQVANDDKATFDEVTAVVVNVDRKTRNIQLSIKAKDAVDQQEAMASLSQQAKGENAGTTSLGALLRAKLDNN